MEEGKKSYYAVIPASVRYDDRLCPNAKLLYGEITALCNETGFCWASNDYFSKLYKASKQSISKWIKQLKEAGYITVSLKYKGGTKEILHRYLRIIGEGIQEKLNTPMKEKLKDNTTEINNTINNTSEEDIYTQKSGQMSGQTSVRFTHPSLQEVLAYCTERNNGVDAQKFCDFYTAKGWLIGKNKMKDWRAAVRTWERSDTRRSNGTERAGAVFRRDKKRGGDPWDDPDYYEHDRV